MCYSELSLKIFATHNGEVAGCDMENVLPKRVFEKGNQGMVICLHCALRYKNLQSTQCFKHQSPLTHLSFSTQSIRLSNICILKKSRIVIDGNKMGEQGKIKAQNASRDL